MLKFQQEAKVNCVVKVRMHNLIPATGRVKQPRSQGLFPCLCKQADGQPSIRGDS